MGCQNYYQILGVTKNATLEEIKKQYRILGRKYHPDLHPNDPNAESMMKTINEAYEILKNSEKRRAYDATLSEKSFSSFVSRTSSTSSTHASEKRQYDFYRHFTSSEVKKEILIYLRNEKREILRKISELHFSKKTFEQKCDSYNEYWFLYTFLELNDKTVYYFRALKIFENSNLNDEDRKYVLEEFYKIILLQYKLIYIFVKKVKKELKNISSDEECDITEKNNKINNLNMILGLCLDIITNKIKYPKTFASDIIVNKIKVNKIKNNVIELINDDLPKKRKTKKTEKKSRGKVFDIKSINKEKTFSNIKKNVFASVAGLGILSFMLMSYTRFNSENNSVDEYVTILKSIINNETFATIFADSKTFFASIITSISGTIGYIVQDEKNNNQKVK